VDEFGTCKISDFGISKKEGKCLHGLCNTAVEITDGGNRKSQLSLQGSIFWMAPEVIRNEGYSAKVDIWGLGCVVLEMFTAQRPWNKFNELATMYKLGQFNAPPLPPKLQEDALDFLQKCFVAAKLDRPTATTLLGHPFAHVDEHYVFNDFVRASTRRSFLAFDSAKK
jgi:serine/threonine protein kinase